MSLLRGKPLLHHILAVKWLIILGLRNLHDMPEHVSNPKGSLMLGYLKDGSDNEHLGGSARLRYPC